ncbi:MAG TPA: PD-(D/E)XK nuclease-like domain-containing protein [Burkholderiales bacterium]|nr:PD-(D/E)XK nuclease-like domain-containing protein [Burkholderiales bacterium]
MKPNYFEVDAISRSALVELLTSPRKAKEALYEKMPPKHFEIGTFVDLLLTDYKQFEDTYYVGQYTKPTEKMGDFAYNVLLAARRDGNTLTRAHILEARELVGYDKRMTEDGIVEKFKKDALLWVEEQLTYGDKIIIDQNTEQQGLQIAQSLESCPEIKAILSDPNIVFQLELYWEMSGEPCKAKLDWAIIDHEKKTITPGDLKTTGDSTANFRHSALRYRYDIQAAWYVLGLQYCYPGYTIYPFKFLVESSDLKKIGSPLIYVCTDEDLAIGKYGANRNPRTEMYTEGTPIKGYTQLLGELIWHRNNNLWDYSFEEYMNKKSVPLNIWR